MFGFRAGEPVIHDPADLAANKGLQSLEPDRVFGLGMTKSFERCVSFQPNLRHSPFGDRRLLYPFLVIEAKSEKGSPGFEYIETQTALPLRTCMKLQEDLANSTESNLTPLVWFMAYQGDQWRVYAGTVHDSAYVSPFRQSRDVHEIRLTVCRESIFSGKVRFYHKTTRFNFCRLLIASATGLATYIEMTYYVAWRTGNWTYET